MVRLAFRTCIAITLVLAIVPGRAALATDAHASGARASNECRSEAANLTSFRSLIDNAETIVLATAKPQNRRCFPEAAF